jgi:hypothetical protein
VGDQDGAVNAARRIDDSAFNLRSSTHRIRADSMRAKRPARSAPTLEFDAQRRVCQRVEAMPTYDVACLREQGIDVIVVVVEAAVANWPRTDQSPAWARMQVQAIEAGLDGTVILLWRATPKRLGYFDPHHRHPFLKLLTTARLARITNTHLTCDEYAPRERARATIASGTVQARHLGTTSSSPLH